jgi:hypothetical protein
MSRSFYDLRKEQAQFLEELFWADDDEYIQAQLRKIDGDVDKKLEYLTTILAEAETKLDVSKCALKSVQERLGKTVKRDEKVVNDLRTFILSVLVDFKKESFKGSLLSVRHGLTPGKLEFTDAFNADRLPLEFVETIPEHREIDNKKVVEHLRASIYDKKLKKLDPNVSLVQDKTIPGVMLVRNESLTVR